MGHLPLKNNRFYINKSRYDSIDCYISKDKRLRNEYNDLPLVYNAESYQLLVDNGQSNDISLELATSVVGVDELLAKHIAHLFIRDPIVIYSELLNQDDEVSSDHFEVFL